MSTTVLLALGVTLALLAGATALLGARLRRELVAVEASLDALAPVTAAAAELRAAADAAARAHRESRAHDRAVAEAGGPSARHAGGAHDRTTTDR